MSSPLLFLPGMMCDARLYSPQAAVFSSVLTLQFAGMTNAESVEALAKNILQQAPPTFALCGLSMGGIIAMEIIRQSPERVERLALLDTNPLPDAPENKAIREAQIDAVQSGNLRSVMRDEMKPRYLADGPQRESILDTCMDMALALGPEVFVRQSLALMNRPDQRETLASVTVPTLVLHGQYDKLCTQDKHEIMHELVTGSSLVQVPDAGHLPVLENPVFTNKVLKKWLQI